MSQYPPTNEPGHRPDYDWHAPQAHQPTKHSGLGIASLFIAGACALILIVGVIMSTVAVMNNPQNPEQDPSVMMAGCMIIFGMLGCLIGVVFGAIGCAAKDRKRVTAIIGLCINAIGVIGICGLMAIGMAAG